MTCLLPLPFLSVRHTLPSLGHLAWDRYAVVSCRSVLPILDLGTHGSSHHLGRGGRGEKRERQGGVCGRFLPVVLEARRGCRKEDRAKAGVFPYLVISQSLLKVGIGWKDGVSGRGDGEYF